MFSNFEKKWRDKEDLTRKMLCFSQEDKDRIEKRAKKNKIDDIVETRLLPEQYYSVLDIIIIDKYVVVTELDETPKTTVYQSSKVIEGYKKQFELFWEMAE